MGAAGDERSPPQPRSTATEPRDAAAAPPRAQAGGADTRAQLLAAARVEFADRGYDGATVRVIAERAGVDAAMVNHWFGGKDSLFTAALDLPIDPATILAEVVPGDPEHLAERISRGSCRCGTPRAPRRSPRCSRAWRAHDTAAQMLREFVEPRARRQGGCRRSRRTGRSCAPGSVGSQLLGLAIVRYVLKVEPLASADHATVIGAVAPNLQRYLTGPLP